MNKKDIESIVPLLPMQQNFLWHSLKKNSASNVIQLRCTLNGTIDTALLRNSWDATVQQYQALRSTVHWNDIKAPIQVIHKRIDSAMYLLERNTSEALSEYQLHDASTQIELTQAPSFRMAIQCATANTCEVVWSMSHVLLDGWSSTVIINTWINIYQNMLDGVAQNPTITLQLSDYSKWIKQQDQKLMIDFWNDYLPKSFNSHSLPYKEPQSPINNSISYKSIASYSEILSKDKFTQLKQGLQTASVSLGAVLQLAFATVMHSKTSTKPIIFATTVSGRQVDIPHIEDHVGMFMNMIPATVQFDSEESILNWAKQYQRGFFNSLPFAHISQLQAASLRAEMNSLYECLLVIENQPAVLSTSTLKVSNYQSAIISEFDLTLVVIPGDELCLEIQFDESLFRKHNMKKLLDTMLDLLANFPTLLNQSVEALQNYKISSPSTESESDTIRFEDSALALSNKQSSVDITSITMLEQSIRDIWSDTLSINNFTLTDSFFDLGGSSIQAILIFNRIKDALDIQLPATALFKAPTIKKLAALIQNEQPESFWSSIIGVNVSGSKPPLFIPFQEADMLMYQPLIAELGSEQPVYGLHVSQGDYPSNELLETLATHIVNIQPAGPYRLAGLSGLGIIALDLAQRLNHVKPTLNLVVLFDSYGPDYPHFKSPGKRLAVLALRLVKVTVGKIIFRLVSYASKLVKKNHNVQLDSNQEYSPERARFTEDFRRRLDEESELTTSIVSEISNKITVADNWVNHIILRLCKFKLLKSTLRIELLPFNQGLLIQRCKATLLSSKLMSSANSLRMEILSLDPRNALPEEPAIVQLLRTYQSMYRGLKPYMGNVLYCRAETRPAGIVDDPLAGWNELLPSTTTITAIPGNHTTILKKPNVQILAEAISRETARLDAER